MATGFPVKANYATGDVLTAANMNDLSGTLNYLQSTANGLLAGKNMAINGGFDIWQRGTSTAASGYLADRWRCTILGGGTSTYSQESTIVPAGSLYSMKIAQTVASGLPALDQAIETLNAIQFAGKTVVMSLQAAATSSQTITMELAYSTTANESVTGATWTGISPTSGGSVTPTSTTFVTGTGVYAVPSTAKSLRIRLYAASIASGNAVYISQVQLELGSTASTFSRAGGTIQGELAACQRYYYRITSTGGDARMLIARAKRAWEKKA